VLPTLIIVFREVFEAGLIIGIVMAVTTGVAGRGLWVVGGVAAGALGACIVALFAVLCGVILTFFIKPMRKLSAGVN